MSLESVSNELNGEIGVKPRTIKLVTTDAFATITAAGWLVATPWYAAQTGLGFVLSPNDLFTIAYESNSATVGLFSLGADNILVPMFVSVGTVNSVVTSATPGTVRAFIGAISQSATTMTSGNIVGVRGAATLVGASGGFIYGVQGKVIATGTLSGSSWTAGLFGQFDFSAATINAGQASAIWGDWGATGATATDLTGCRGIAFTNTTANVLNAQDYRYGNATYLLELAGAGGTLNYYADAGTASGSAGNSTHCAAQKVIKVLLNSGAVYIPVFTQNS